jgi:hypothetical protein
MAYTYLYNAYSHLQTCHTIHRIVDTANSHKFRVSPSSKHYLEVRRVNLFRSSVQISRSDTVINNICLPKYKDLESGHNDIHGDDLRSEDAAHGACVVSGRNPTGRWLARLWRQARRLPSKQHAQHLYRYTWTAIYVTCCTFSMLLDRNPLRGRVLKRHYYADDALR